MKPTQSKGGAAAREAAFDACAAALRQASRRGEAPGPLALAAAWAAGLAPRSRNRFGESLLEAAARLGCESACMELMELGADPFEPTACVDSSGQFARLRGFEAFIAQGMAGAIARAAAGLDPGGLDRERLRWRGLARRTHAQLRLWRSGAGWMHLAAAAHAPASVRALAALGVGVDDLDDTGSGPLMPCATPRGGDERCARELMILGASPWDRNLRGERPADFMPADWAGLRALAEAGDLDAACPAGEGSSGRAKSL